MAPDFDSKTVLVVCEGNQCRSPIAVGLLRKALGARLRVESAGLAAPEGLPAHPEAARAMDGTGIDLAGHASRQLTPAMALAADLILVMDRAQKDWCEAMVPSVRGRVFLLGHWQRPAPVEVADPYRRGPEAFRAAFETINQCVSGWVPHLISEQRSA